MISAFVVVVLQTKLLQARKEIVQGRNAESKMKIVSRSRRLFLRNQMQLVVLADLEPYMPVVAKWIGNNFATDHFLIKRATLFQARDVQRDMVETIFHLTIIRAKVIP